MALERLNFRQNGQVELKKHKFSRKPKRNQLVVLHLKVQHVIAIYILNRKEYECKLAWKSYPTPTFARC